MHTLSYIWLRVIEQDALALSPRSSSSSAVYVFIFYFLSRILTNPFYGQTVVSHRTTHIHKISSLFTVVSMCLMIPTHAFIRLFPSLWSLYPEELSRKPYFQWRQSLFLVRLLKSYKSIYKAI